MLKQFQGAARGKGELPAARIELTAVVFIHVYGLVAWGDPTAGGSIPLALSERLSAGITFAVGNTRAFAAVGQQGELRRHLKTSFSIHFQFIINSFLHLFTRFNSFSSHFQVNFVLSSLYFIVFIQLLPFISASWQGSVTTWGDPACGGHSGHVAEQLQSRAFQICHNEWAGTKNT